MTLNEDYNQIFEELHYLQNCKLGLAIFYDLFSHKFLTDRDIWQCASVEEVCQARWIGRLTSLISPQSPLYSLGNIKIGEMKNFQDEINQHTELVNQGQISDREMLAIALKYEQLNVIKNPFEAVRCETPEYLELTSNFAPVAEEHALRIQEHIKARLATI
jgi:hypothetical protein